MIELSRFLQEFAWCSLARLLLLFQADSLSLPVLGW